MPNHWHLVVSPEEDGGMSRFGQWLGLTHTRYNAHYHTTGEGYLYQGRYKSFPIQGDDHFLSVCRYVERNAYSAGLCNAPEQWPFGSLSRWRFGTVKERSRLSKWPVPRKANWVEQVRQALSSKERQRLQWCMKLGSPFGDKTWVESMGRRLNLESTLRPRGRGLFSLNGT